MELSADGKIKLVTPSEIDITGNVKITGDLDVTGHSKSGSISLATHTHPVTTAPGTTGAPT